MAEKQKHSSKQWKWRTRKSVAAAILSSTGALTVAACSNLMPAAPTSLLHSFACTWSQTNCQTGPICDGREEATQQYAQICADRWETERKATQQRLADESAARDAQQEKAAQEEQRSRDAHPPEYHRVATDTVGCYTQGIYQNGDYVGSTHGCVEIHRGQVFLLQPNATIGDGGKITYSAPLALKITATGGLFSSMALPSYAFDKKVLHCDSKRVLLHVEVSCDD